MKSGWIFIFCFLLVLPASLVAQQIDADSVFYQRLFKRADKHKWTRWLYDITFEKTGESEVDIQDIISTKKKKNPFLKYKGKAIKDIQFIVLDPFGYSVNNFYSKHIDYLDKMGNRYHITTSNYVIENLLLFKKDSALDPLTISESERILRLSPYIYDARIYVTQNGKGVHDSVDVMVVVQDKWSTTAWSQFDVMAPNIKISENNFLGMGHQFQEDFIWRRSSEYFETTGRYGIYNIKNTFIQAAAFYSTVKESKQFGGSLFRPFYSPLAKWAGGLTLIRNNTRILLTNPENATLTSYALNYNVFESWGAKSFPLTRKKAPTLDQRSSNFIFGLGYFRTDYELRPAMIFDSVHSYQSEKFYVCNFGFSRRRYYRDRFLFRFGANEDVPEGLTVEYLLGKYQRETETSLLYYGLKLAAGRHFEDFGYISGNAGFGTLSDGKNWHSGVLNIGSFYFSDLMKMNRWHFRQLTRFNLINGINRNAGELLNINGTQMYGFSSSLLNGNTKMVINFEFIMYTPYKLLGFQFAPVLYLGFAGMSQNVTGLLGSTLYQSYAIGLLIRNEYLISSTFQLSIGYYPYMPGESNNMIKANPINSYDLRARDYFISKPEKVAYQ